MDWIKAPVRYRDDPRIHDMASKLSITFEAALGRYISALMFCGDHETVALPASLDGPTREAMRGSGLHDGKRFVDHDAVVGSLARARAHERERKKRESRKLLNSKKDAPRNSGAYREGEGDRERERDKAETEKSKASVAPSGRVAPGGTRLPDDFTLEARPELLEAASALGFTEAAALEALARFTDYWRGVAGARGRKADWLATWRNWLRRDRDDRTTVTRRSPARGPAPAARFRVGTYAPTEEES